MDQLRMDLNAAATLDPARQGRAPGHVERAWAHQHGERRGLPPRPPPPPRPLPHGADGRRGVKVDGAGGGDKGRGGVADCGVVTAGAEGANVATVACGLGSNGAHGVARSVVVTEESGGGEVGAKRWSAPPTAHYPPPKRRAVSAKRRFPPGCGRDAAAPLAGADDGSRLGDARASDGGSAPLQKAAAAAAAPLAGSRDGAPLEAFSPTAAPGALGTPTAADGAGIMVPGGDHGPEAGVVKSSEASGRNGVAGSDNWLVAGSQGIARSGEMGSNELVPAMRLLPKPRMVSAKHRFPPECGRVGISLIGGGGSSELCLPLKEEEVATDGASSVADRIVVTARKLIQPAKVIQESDLDTQRRSFSKDKGKDKETELVRRVTTDEIEDTDEFTKDSVVQARMSADKCPWTEGEVPATTKDYFGPKKKVNVKGPVHLPIKVTSACALGSKVNMVTSNLEDDDILKAILKAVAVHEGMLELYVNSSSSVPSMRCQRGVQNADARSKVKMMRRRFEFICRTLAKAVEQRSLKVRRIDLAADKAIRKLPGFTKHGPIVGNVPGVEIGDEFLYRVELAIIGLHRPYQGGIDTTKDRNGVLIAISIVASGGYPDELSSSGELVYTGSGGKLAGKKDDEDQKLERGNLALKNCIKTKSPVRVIHGFKDHNRDVGGHSRAREMSTFTYDGLYHVVDCWRKGQPGSKVFKFKLQRIPGQPELPHCSKTGIMC